MDKKICLVGLSYIDLPLAVEMAKHFTTTGFDINQKRIETIKSKEDPNYKIKYGVLAKSNLAVSYNSELIKEVFEA